MSYSIIKLPNKKYKVQFRSRHILGSINRTFNTRNEAIFLGKELNESLGKLIIDEEAKPAYPAQTLLDSPPCSLTSHVLHRPYFSGKGFYYVR